MVPEIKKLVATKDTVALCQQLKELTTNEKLQNILDKIAADYGQQPFNLREFINLFWTLCSATKVSNIPQYIDRVLIAPVNDWVPTRVQYLFIANCTAENFPQGQDDNDILQEADLVATQITPTPSLQRERNYRHAELLKVVPTAQLVLSGTCDDFTNVDYQACTTFYWPHEKNEQFHQAALTVGNDLFFPSGKVKTTMLETYYACPRLNFIQNGLQLRPRPLHQLQANTVGSAIHVALETYFKQHDLEKAVTAGVQALAYDYPPLTKNIAKEIRFILQRLSAIFATSGFKLETKVETDIQRPLKHGLTLVGRVDRVDVAQLDDGSRAFMVLDYKTGNVNEGVARSIYLGNKLQLPVYSSALSKKLGRTKEDTARIAGAAYLPLSSGYATDEKKFLLKGFVDRECKNLFPPALINQSARYYLDGDLILKMCQYANDLVDDAVERILAGNVAPQAVDEGTCKYCPIKALCPQAEINCRDENLQEETGEKQITFKIFEKMKGGEHE